MDTRENAEMLALQALGWLAATEDLLPVFLGSSGLEERDLRERVDDPDLLAAVLDFLLMDDAWVMAFCNDQEIAYDRVVEARSALPGGEQVHWT